MFYFIKGYRASLWGSKDLNFGGNNLTNINFGNIRNEIKFMDTLQYYQKSLGELASTLTENEKKICKNFSMAIFKPALLFWRDLEIFKWCSKNKNIGHNCRRKRHYSIWKNCYMNSLFSTPKNGTFFEKTEFFSKLKQKAVSDEDYTTSFYLYKTLKMWHLGDMNDLYNVQDVILLSVICKSRFQFMHKRYGFNPRKCNSASTLSGCIEREMSRVINALPTSNEVFRYFWTNYYRRVQLHE